ncbi:MAG TPA: M15 family metallopeptidase [Actinomycetales bacterium]|nr:M15 family metallopeptidase [Actinomycetales bacterium]
MPSEPSARSSARAAAHTGDYRGRRRVSDQPAEPTAAYRGRHAAPRTQHSRSAGAVVAVGIVGVAGMLAQALPGQAGQAAQAATRSGDAAASNQADAGSHQPATALAPSRDIVSAVPAPIVATSPRMTAVSRAKERAQMPGCRAKGITTDYANGRIPADELCTLPWDKRHRLRADAAIALAELDAAYNEHFDKDLCLTDSYRSLASQVSLAARKPGLAARPGSSEHGWGLAVDLCDGGDVAGTPEHDWLLKNAPEFGWDNPAWARPGGSRPEAWHWEYVAGETSQQK